jgi:hypothetical protein
MQVERRKAGLVLVGRAKIYATYRFYCFVKKNVHNKLFRNLLLIFILHL